MGCPVVFVELENSQDRADHAARGRTRRCAKFLESNPAGGMHHVCFEVADLASAARTLVEGGARVLGEPKLGAHGLPVLFLHPKDFDGVLIELEEVKPELQPA